MFWRSKRGYEDFSEEIRAHIDLEAARLVEDGMDPRAARVEALKRFGNVVASRERFYESGRAVWLERTIQDLRYAVRLLRRSSGFTLTVVLIMAVTIGANTAVFSVVNGVLLKPLPYPASEQLVAFWNGITPSRSDVLNSEALAALRETSRNLEAVSAFSPGSQILNPDGSATQHELVRVSSNFFSEVLRVSPAVGRDFTPEDEQAGAPPTAIISDGLWRNYFGSDPEIAGRVIRPRPSPGAGPLGGGQYPPLQIIGVLPSNFRSPDDLGSPDIWTVSNSLTSGNALFRAFGRLRSGVTVEEARAEIAAVQGQILEAGGEPMVGRQLLLMELAGFHEGGTGRQSIPIFFGAVLAVLLVGVSNLIGLELAWLPRIENDLSIHAALGATRGRMAQLTMTRSLLVCLTGGLAGTLLAVATHGLLLASLPLNFPRQLDIRIDTNVLLFSIGLSILCSLAIASISTIRASRPDLRAALASADRSATESGRQRTFRNLLTAAQTGVALVLVFAAGLLIHIFWIVTTVDTGFDPNRVLFGLASLPDDYSPIAKQNVLERTIETLSAAPEVEAAAISRNLPMYRISSGFFKDPAGIPLPQPPPAGVDWYDEFLQAGYRSFESNAVSGEYFESMTIPIIEGRTFTVGETRGAAAVAVVSDSVARAFWPGRNPIGQRLEWVYGSDNTLLELSVVGVVGDVRFNLRRQKEETIYIPAAHIFRRDATSAAPNFIVAKTSLPPDRVEDLLARIDPNVAIDLNPMSERLALQTARDRFRATALGVVAAIALIVAVLGVYTTVAHSVVRRTREIGLRMALGAERSSVFVSVLLHALAPAALGLALGVAGSFPFQQALGAYIYLFGIDPSYVGTYAAVVLLMSAVLVSACAVPAFRASKVDPLTALGHD